MHASLISYIAIIDPSHLIEKAYFVDGPGKEASMESKPCQVLCHIIPSGPFSIQFLFHNNRFVYGINYSPWWNWYYCEGNPTTNWPLVVENNKHNGIIVTAMSSIVMN